MIAHVHPSTKFKLTFNLKGISAFSIALLAAKEPELMSSKKSTVSLYNTKHELSTCLVGAHNTCLSQRLELDTN